MGSLGFDFRSIVVIPLSHDASSLGSNITDEAEARYSSSYVVATNSRLYKTRVTTGILYYIR